MTAPPGRRVALHDYGAYPFTLELAGALAGRGHEVLYLYSASVLAPNVKGGFETGLRGVEVRPVTTSRPIRKQAFLSRWVREREYGRNLADAVASFHPDVVLSANTPLEAQKRLQRRTRADGARFVYWVQDLYGVAAHRILRRRLPVVGDLVGRYYRWLERTLVARSDTAVLITSGFVEALGARVARKTPIHVIPNWAPLDRTPVRPRSNAWARGRELTEPVVFLYSGTLGMKHDPGLLLDLARRIDPLGGRVVVVSEGVGADWLAGRAAAESVVNLEVHPFQPAELLPDVLGAADVLVALLEPEAGQFSVPSKILTYLCAGRPILASLPAENLAAEIIRGAECGVVVEAGGQGWGDGARELATDADRRDKLGMAGRAYAERHFDITAITDRFEAIVNGRTEAANA